MRNHPVDGLHLRSRRAPALGAALIAALALAACGSSSSSSSSSGTAASAAAPASTTTTSTTSASPTTATSTATVAAAGSSSEPPLIVGDQAGTGSEAILQAAGMLKKLPFTVKFADFTAGPPILEAVNANDVEIGGVGNAPVAFAAAAGDKLKIVAATKGDAKSAAVVVPKGSSITSITQLKGKKIAVDEGTSGEAHLLAVLAKAGLSIKDVTIENLAPAEALEAFESGQVDAWDVWSPYVEEATAKGGKVLIDGSGVWHEYSYEVASTEALSDPTKAKEIKQYLAALVTARKWVNAHPTAWAKTWAASTGLPQSVMLTAAQDDVQTPVAVSAATATQPEQTLVNEFYNAGLVPKKASFTPYVTTAFNSTVS
jgi:sulfonate transport system substrate-binding protein